MIKKVTKPFDDYILFSNGAINQTLFINMKNLKSEGSNFYYHTIELFIGKVKYRAVVMSNDEKELEEYRSKHELFRR